ncbi:hypothetical protein ACFLZY_01250 [Patescibacteria group bacterium]
METLVQCSPRAVQSPDSEQEEKEEERRKKMSSNVESKEAKNLFGFQHAQGLRVDLPPTKEELDSIARQTLQEIRDLLKEVVQLLQDINYTSMSL